MTGLSPNELAARYAKPLRQHIKEMRYADTMKRRICVMALMVVPACDGVADRGDSLRDGLGSVEVPADPVVENVGEGLWDGVAPWDIREAFTIGTVSGSAPYEFARIGSIDVDRDGNIFVWDLGHRRVRKFDNSGRFLLEMGADGGGPGEFSLSASGRVIGLGGMALVGDSLVVVHDPWAWKLVYFDKSGEVRRDVSLQDLSPPGSIIARRSHVLSDLGGGWLLLEHRNGYGSGKLKSPSDGQHALVRIATDGTDRDSLVVYPQERSIHVWFDDRNGEFFPKPFPAQWHWTVGPAGQIAFGFGGTYEITVYTESWEPDARMTRAVTPRAVTNADISDFRRRFPFGGGTDSLSPILRRFAEGVLRSLEMPETWPYFDDLVYDGVGRLWVRRPPSRGDLVAEWDVFDAELRYLGAVELPSDLVVLKITRDRIYSRVQDELGVHFVKVHQLFAADTS